VIVRLLCLKCTCECDIGKTTKKLDKQQEINNLVASLKTFFISSANWGFCACVNAA
jgi:hypothetical protein